MNSAERAELIRQRFIAKRGAAFVPRPSSRKPRATEQKPVLKPYRSHFNPGVSLYERRLKWVQEADERPKKVLKPKRRTSTAPVLTKMAAKLLKKLPKWVPPPKCVTKRK